MQLSGILDELSDIFANFSNSDASIRKQADVIVEEVEEMMAKKAAGVISEAYDDESILLVDADRVRLCM
uniref:SRP54_N domain-containing protein n=1 Tax=Angiostrongylus cantonensis TaxID=6313 RepID=A0A0K0DLU5_ANGCA